MPTTGSSSLGFDDVDGNMRVVAGETFASSRFIGIIYVIEERIGSGSFGIVISVRCEGAVSATGIDVHGNAPRASSRYAIKIARSKPAFAAQASIELSLLVYLNRLRSVDVSAQLCGVIELVDHFVLRGHVCLVEELLPGTLLDALAVRSYTGLPLRDIATILYSLLRTLHELHVIGLLHGDIKPENVMLSGVGGEELLAKGDKGDKVGAAEGNIRIDELDVDQADVFPSVFTSNRSISRGSEHPSSRRGSEYSNLSYNLSHRSSDRRSSDHRSSDRRSSETTVPLNRRASESIIHPVALYGTDNRISSAGVNSSSSAIDDPLSANSIAEMNKVVNASRARASLSRSSMLPPSVHLVDFGSAGYEVGGLVPQCAYAQSRFYRAPEVLLGLRHTGAIDMWSTGCLAAELWLGLPIFGGFDEHDCVSRMCLLLGLPPEGMLETSPLAPRFFSLKRPGNSATLVTAASPKAAASVGGWGRSATGAGSVADHAGGGGGDGRIRSSSDVPGFAHAQAAVAAAPDLSAINPLSKGLLTLDSVERPGVVKWVSPIPMAAASDSWYRLKSPDEFSAGTGIKIPTYNDVAPLIPSVNAKHYISPVPLGVTIISIKEEAGLISALVPPASTLVYSQVSDALLALYSDDTAVTTGRAFDTSPTQNDVLVPDNVSADDSYLRVAFADLVARLLVFDPRMRLTAAESLDHYFFSAAGVEGRDDFTRHAASNAHLRARRGDHGCVWMTPGRAWAGGGAGEEGAKVRGDTSTKPVSMDVFLSRRRNGIVGKSNLSPESPSWNPGGVIGAARIGRSMTVTDIPVAWIGGKIKLQG